MTLNIFVSKNYIFASVEHVHQFYWWIHCKTLHPLGIQQQNGNIYPNSVVDSSAELFLFFYYRFRIKPHFFKTLFQSQFLFDYDEIFINKSVKVCSFCDYFNIFFESIDFKYSRFKHKLELYVFKSTFIVLSS